MVCRGFMSCRLRASDQLAFRHPILSRKSKSVLELIYDVLYKP